jgi:hypothetical protein
MRLKEIARKVEGVRHGEKTYFCDLNEVIAYVAKKKNTMPNKQPNSPSDDSTMEEVEQCIREQMQCLPDWWNEDTEKMANATVTTLIRGKF